MFDCLKQKDPEMTRTAHQWFEVTGKQITGQWLAINSGVSCISIEYPQGDHSCP